MLLFCTLSSCTSVVVLQCTISFSCIWPHHIILLIVAVIVEPRELKQMWKQFKKETPQGVINQTEFKEVMKQMGVVDGFLQELIFNVFDDNKDGTINFQVFCKAFIRLSCLLAILTLSPGVCMRFVSNDTR